MKEAEQYHNNIENLVTPVEMMIDDWKEAFCLICHTQYQKLGPSFTANELLINELNRN
jgi:frataxin-like iron-binding protein CyaY